MNTLWYAAATTGRRVAACLLVLSCFALLMATGPAPAVAQECEDGSCTYIKIYNCTKYEYKMQFKLCCDGEIKVTDCYYIPGDACEGAAKFDFDPCTIINVGFCSPLPPGVNYYWEESGCYLKIYYD